MKKRLTIPQLQTYKQEGKKIRVITAYDYPFAHLVNGSDIEIILVGDSLGMAVLGYTSTVPVTMEQMLHHCRPVVAGAPDTMVFADLPFGSYNVSIEQAITNANRFMQEGAVDGVKLEGGVRMARTVAAIVEAGIPVMGHIGLTPQTATQLGGFKVQGKDEATARQLIEDALALEAAGVCSIVLECVPAPLAAEITGQLKVPTIGIGAGPDCDGQVLVIHDLIGMYDRFVPKFVKQYAQVGQTISQALAEYAQDVATGRFPDADHSFGLHRERDESRRLY
ncbi:3-methyl-2-oxobutanoate hydroxymethyltransferase [Heliophilum fasciatum]|uniref:3-methyl-2-oxobutanoate hydroxymethyltransferase n=1 Tax=Heliophilum fasciatum TaxID=35700 RepID=A0A4R2S747_9FIRM|nr:3-methyl-2-oxobutanoate hydroxymethyltransferase [Heliophilum fasciatum]MCW2277153.1 3-methyl-2-oxobutanoate hydroxymethyltransferase [Heliophilum fasciatum]TCP68211.1 ketopantoate hydroxymethyltransferase [Heliophilum fasciatum]